VTATEGDGKLLQEGISLELELTGSQLTGGGKTCLDVDKSQYKASNPQKSFQKQPGRMVASDELSL
jgi:hypothetical protein